jgi:glucokinase
MSTKNHLFVGTDCGATTSKIGAVWASGKTVSRKLLQHPTNSQQGPGAVVAGWVEAIDGYLAANKLGWKQVKGVGLAIPGPYERYGVLAHSANLPVTFDGWNFYAAYSRAIAKRAGRKIPLTVGNDGAFGGVGEAKHARGSRKGCVLLLAPGSGLGSAYIGENGLPLVGDTLAAMETAHMAAPLQLLGAKPYKCGCGREWGCIELYTTLAGLPYLLEERLASRPDHPLAQSPKSPREKALSLRGLAQSGDALAVELFDFQARAMGLHVANLSMALDPRFVVIGGGLMDPENTTPAFRDRYLQIVRETCATYLWPVQRKSVTIVPSALGELSQAIGAALASMYASLR